MEGSNKIFQTMQSIMAIKTQELAKKRDNWEALRKQLMLSLEGESDPRQRVKLLVGEAGARVVPDGSAKVRRKDLRDLDRKKESAQHEEILELAGISGPNVQRLLDHAKLDLAVSPALLRSIEESFVSALTATEVKYKYATLFGNLVRDATPEAPAGQTTMADASEPGTPSFEAVGRSDMHEQRKVWESLVFTPNELDQKRITTTLEQVFGSSEARDSLYTLRKSINKLCHDLLDPDSIDNDDVKHCVTGLISSDLLSQDQTNTLKELRESPSHLSELADVLKLRIADIDKWTWGTDAMPVEMRRQLNGKYRVFMHEEITQAIFIYYIGMKFAIAFLECFHKFYESAGWKKPQRVGQRETARFDYFIGARTPGKSSIYSSFETKFKSEYLMSVLPNRMDADEGYSAEDATNKADQSPSGKSVAAKQALLHLVKTETMFADYFERSLYVLQTDFRWFGPSLSHSTVAATMKFFGTTDVWLGFFEKFLKAPMRFTHDGPDAQVRVRERGVPMSHVLSTVFGEVVLFCLDFVVNEATRGKPMFRLHDDVWLWGDLEQCTTAWKALTDLSDILGIEINTDKTGSARLTAVGNAMDDGDSNGLPKGKLSWGFLTIHEDGVIRVERETVDKHITEFRRQLEAQKSIISWVRAYNAYSRFVVFNLCRPANSLGRQHVDQSLAVLAHIHRELFPSTNGSVSEHIKSMIRDRYGVEDVPDGFVYLPMRFGGLEVFNPVISLMNMRENVDPSPTVILDEAIEADRLEYERLKEVFEKKGPKDRLALKEMPGDFMSYDEYSSFHWERNSILHQAWTDLLEPAKEEQLELRAEIESLIDQLPTQEGYGQYLHWHNVEPYWQAVFDMYGSEMSQKFGGLTVVGKKLLPLGMIDLLKGKVRWES